MGGVGVNGYWNGLADKIYFSFGLVGLFIIFRFYSLALEIYIWNKNSDFDKLFQFYASVWRCKTF